MLAIMKRLKEIVNKITVIEENHIYSTSTYQALEQCLFCYCCFFLNGCSNGEMSQK